MGIGISKAAALLWQAYDSESYNECLLEEGDEYYFFSELPDWAYQKDVGPFFIDDDGAIWSVTTRPSQAGVLIGNLV